MMVKLACNLIFIFICCQTLCLHSFYSHRSLQRPLRLLKMSEESQIKLPIVQIFSNGTLSSEFICGNDLETSIQKIKSVLSSSKAAPGSSYISNIYSDSMLKSAIESISADKVIVKIYRDGCKKCIKLEPDFYSLSGQYTSGFQWYQAKAEDIPEHTNSIKARLRGLAPVVPINSESTITTSSIENCIDCKGTGAIPCSACQGVGFTMQGSYGVTCSTCGGKKVVRCTSCGGKCLNC